MKGRRPSVQARLLYAGASSCARSASNFMLFACRSSTTAPSAPAFLCSSHATSGSDGNLQRQNNSDSPHDSSYPPADHFLLLYVQRKSAHVSQQRRACSAHYPNSEFWALPCHGINLNTPVEMDYHRLGSADERFVKHM